MECHCLLLANLSLCFWGLQLITWGPPILQREMCYTQSLKRGKEFPLKSLKPMGAGGETWLSGPTSIDEWLACIPPQSASSLHWRASASLSWGNTSEIWPESTYGSVFLWNSLRTRVSIAWSNDHSPHHRFHSLTPTRCLTPEHPVFIPSPRFECSGIQFPKIPNILISALLVSVFSLLGKKKNVVWKGKLTVDEF